MALEMVYCICGQSNNNGVFMIHCDLCKIWFHGRCVGVREYQAVDIDRFHCPRCELIHGPSVLKPRLNWHRHDYSEADAATRSVQTGTQVFIKELKARHFQGCEDIILRLDGQQLTLPYFIANDFNKPILVEDKNGLDLVVPHSSFSVLDVENYVGSDLDVDVIDVQRQTNVRMQLHEFVEYFLSPARTTVLNLISLEFSDTSLSQLVEPPYIVRKLCWVTSSWPTDPPPPPPLVRPNVNKYCLVSVENSYTDFHVDFGGTSVWYHVLWGEKIFYLIKPTPANLALYQRWMKSNNQSELFFGDQVDNCYKCIVRAGQTLFIPTGWIHSVLTPTDTLVFGGNFLHSYNIELQLQVYEMEKLIGTPEKFQFPCYEKVCWYAAVHLVEELRHMASTGTKVPTSIISGTRCLMSTLRHWSGENERLGIEPPPPGIQPMKLLKELQKEIRVAERQVVALHPLKPERESKRKKKKVISDDFVDYTDLTSFNSVIEDRVPGVTPVKVDDSMVDSPESGSNNSSANYQILERLDPDSSKATLKMTLPKPTSYPYGVGIGMSGTPPHDPSYPPFKNEYPSNVKSEFDWSITSEIPHKYVDSSNLRLRLARNTFEGVHITPSTPPPPYMGPHDTTQGIRIKFSESHFQDSPTNSLYDLNDENDERDPPGLMIDESPKQRRANHHRQILQQPIRMKLNLSAGDILYGEPFEMGSNVEVLPAHSQHIIPNSAVAANGIDELLRASAYAPDLSEGSTARLDDLETGRASPSTREAIAGMLSMSRVITGGRNSGRKLATTGFGNKNSRLKKRFVEDENITKVHQDEDYVYPSLDASDEEEYSVFKPRGKKKEDEAWNPKARIRVSGPKPERPMRQGVKKQSVEKGLEEAAARRQNVPMAKRGYHRKKLKTFDPLPCTSSGSSNRITNNFSKSKKGMATAKQRLGKIMKIHKMIY